MPPRRLELSSAARRVRRPGFLGWGIALLIIALGAGMPVLIALRPTGEHRPEPFGATVIMVVLMAIIGVALLLLGMGAERRAVGVDRHDRDLADALATALDDLARRPAAEAYDTTAELSVISGARVLEVTEEIDQVVVDRVVDVLAAWWGQLGPSFATSSAAALAGREPDSARLEDTARRLREPDLRLQDASERLSSGALSVLVEAPGPSGARDTFRVICLPAQAMRHGMGLLLTYVARQFGGTASHAGAAVGQARTGLVDQFVPSDTAYAFDRLAVQRDRQLTEREPMTIVGAPIGRNAILAVTMVIGGGEPVRLVPAGFATLVGRAVGAAVASALTARH